MKDLITDILLIFFAALVILALTVGWKAHGEGLLGDSTERSHFAVHFLVSGAIYSGIYLFSHDVMEIDKPNSFIIGAVTTLLLGLTYKCMEQMDQSTPVDFKRPMIYNGFGILLPAIVLWHFDL